MAATHTSRDDDIRAFFRLIATGSAEDIQRVLALEPGLVHVVGPHPYWGGRPQALHVAIDAEHDATAKDWAEFALGATGNPRCAEVVAHLSGTGENP